MSADSPSTIDLSFATIEELCAELLGRSEAGVIFLHRAAPGKVGNDVVARTYFSWGNGIWRLGAGYMIAEYERRGIDANWPNPMQAPGEGCPGEEPMP